jgi:hypothetical protein
VDHSACALAGICRPVGTCCLSAGGSAARTGPPTPARMLSMRGSCGSEPFGSCTIGKGRHRPTGTNRLRRRGCRFWLGWCCSTTGRARLHTKWLMGNHPVGVRRPTQIGGTVLRAFAEIARRGRGRSGGHQTKGAADDWARAVAVPVGGSGRPGHQRLGGRLPAGWRHDDAHVGLLPDGRWYGPGVTT